MGLCPIIRMAVCPVPRLIKHRPGANRLIVAIPLAATGASRNPGTLTPVPSCMVRVCCAAKASTAQQLDRIIWLSVTQQ